ncbi:unnamed protein product, partial [Oppiella nova]
MDERGTPINRAPSVGGKDLNLYKLYRIVVKMGGYNRVTNKNSWRAVYGKLGLPGGHTAPGKESSAVYQLKAAYKKFLHSFDDFYRKLGCTITVNSRTSRPSRGERLREEKPPVLKKSVKKERDSKKEDTKEEKETKEKDSTEKSSAVDVVPTPPPTSAKGKDRREDRREEREKEREVKEEPKEDTKSAAKEVPVKEEASSSRVKTEELAPFEERKRGRGRKKKDEPNDEVPPTGAVDEDTMTGQSTIDESDEEDDKKYSKNKTVDESMIKVGDGLKVKYGRGRQLKVYEAKVLKIELDKESNKNKYFVHYSGWNSRYDEWIKKSRIVQVIRDRSPRRRSGKLKNKGETLTEVAQVPPNAGTGGGSGGPPGGGAAPAEKSAPVVGPPVLSSQNSVSSVHSNDSALDGSTTSSVSPAKQSSGTPAPKRGRPPNSVKSSVKTEVIVKEEPKSQPSSRDEKQSQPKSPPTAPTPQTLTPSTPVGRRGRPPLSVKKEKLTRSKSVNEEQSTQDSIATSAEESTTKSSEDKKSTNQLSDNDSNDKSGEEDRDVVKTKGVTPPELHDENTVENKMADDD